MLNSSDLVDLYRRRGALAYEGEGVSQWLHGWQCGHLALQAGAEPALQLAAWLHDIGHLLDEQPGTPTLQGLDDRHESRGAALLDAVFGCDVAAPVALHVQAKRHLVAIRPDYLQRLSADSLRSLALQGGPMSPAESAHFKTLPGAQESLRLRAWDDFAKDPRWQPESFDAALHELERLIHRVRHTAPC
ncbi:phosphohydrolase (plasmid) [Sphaerotilus sulfidivorans]|uniref:phosphohydrolase n=1 Tax=Sphaerotilus sp. FB-3 TaxID=2913396 RepID=UPI00203DD792|nr:phosphohydrolase [Sphaerotilus sp. FB-3]